MKMPPLPGQRDKNQKDAEAALIKQAEDIANGFAQIANTPNGIDTLKWLMNKCGYQLPTDNLDAAGLAYNAGRQNLWLDIRRFLTYEVQIAVEHTVPVVTKIMSEDEQ